MTRILDRRTFLGASAAAAGSFIAATAPDARPAFADAPPAGKMRTTTMTYTIKPLPFDPQKIKGLSERILLSHYENNYGGAVKRLNAIAEQLANLDYEKAPGFLINGLKREELIATNSMILHEAYFAGLGEPNQPGPRLTEAINRDFGGTNAWRAEFVAMGKAEAGGSGWVILTYSPHDGRLVNAWAADHTTTLAGGIPILVLDMYEHAYQMDFGAKAADYVAAFMNVIDWSNADKVFDQYGRT